jgi:hypothetical protein
MAKLGSILLKLIIKLLVNGGTGILILLILFDPLVFKASSPIGYLAYPDSCI